MICEKCNQEEVPYGVYACKSCRMIYMKEWNKLNRDRQNKKSLEWVKNNPEKRKEICRNSDKKNRDSRIVYKKKHYKENPDKHKDWASRASPESKKEKKNRYLALLKANKVGVYTREQVFERDNYKCFYCGSEANEIDHKTPISRNGKDSLRNVVACCRPCNREKHNKTATEYLKYRIKFNMNKTERP